MYCIEFMGNQQKRGKKIVKKMRINKYHVNKMNIKTFQFFKGEEKK